MHPFAWLEDVFGTRSKCAVLRLLHKQPDAAWTERAMAKRLWLSPNTVNRAVRELEDAEVLATAKVGRAHVVRFGDAGYVEIVRRILELEQEAGRLVLRKMAEAVPEGVDVRIFGSTARGEAFPDSDLDVFIQGRDDDAMAEAGLDVYDAGRAIMPIPWAPAGWSDAEAPHRAQTDLGKAIAAAPPISEAA